MPHASRLPTEKEDKQSTSLADIRLNSGDEEDVPGTDNFQLEVLASGETSYANKQKRTRDKNYAKLKAELGTSINTIPGENSLEQLRNYWKLVMKKYYSKEVHATFLGPLPWMSTANVLKTHLYVSSWVSLR